MQCGDFQRFEKLLNLAAKVLWVRGHDSKTEKPRLEIQLLRSPGENDQAKNHDSSGNSSDREKTAASCHSDSGFDKDGGGRSHADEARIVFQNRSGAEKADALHDVGSDASAAAVIPQMAEFTGKNSEQRGCHADKHTGADARRTPMDVPLDADGRTHRGGENQTENDFVKGKKHELCGGSKKRSACTPSYRLQRELRQLCKVTCPSVYLALFEL